MSTASKKKVAGSDLSSTRGSEERHSSVQAQSAGPRGQKRSREFEIEKVGESSPSLLRTASTSVQSASTLVPAQQGLVPPATVQSDGESSTESDGGESPSPNPRKRPRLEEPVPAPVPSKKRKAVHQAEESAYSAADSPPPAKRIRPNTKVQARSHGHAFGTARTRLLAQFGGQEPGELTEGSIVRPAAAASVTAASATTRFPVVFAFPDAAGAPSTPPPDTTTTTTTRGRGRGRGGRGSRGGRGGRGGATASHRGASNGTYHTRAASRGGGAQALDNGDGALVGRSTKTKRKAQSKSPWIVDGGAIPTAGISIDSIHPVEMPRDANEDEDIINYFQEEQFHTRPSVRLTVPDQIKGLLVDDWENITKNLQLVALPSARPVNVILQDYFDEESTRRTPGTPEYGLLEEMIQGTREYFEKALGRILLYRFERHQLKELRELWITDTDGKYKGPADVYGAEHLSRLFGMSSVHPFFVSPY